MDVTVFRSTTRQQLGPFSAATVHEMLARGELSKDDLIHYEGLTQWAPISTLPSPGANPPALRSPAANALATAAPLTLEARVAELERRLARSNLHSPKFWARAFAVLGHNLTAVLAIYAVFFVIALVIMLIAAMFGGLRR